MVRRNDEPTGPRNCADDSIVKTKPADGPSKDPQDPIEDRTHNLAAITTIIWSTTSATDNVEVSMNRASLAGTSGATERERSRVSRPARSAFVSSSAPECPAATSSRCRRWALTVGSASRKNFTSAEGNTLVPISRPSATTAPPCPICRWMGSSQARTAGIAETTDAAADTAGVRRSPLTSLPLTNTVAAP